MINNKSIILIVFVLGTTSLLFAADRLALPDSIVGTWTGKSVLHLSLASPITPGHVPKDSLEIQIYIDKYGTIRGTVGDATFRECIASKNRGWLGRLLNIKTDYIIKDGYLEGRLGPEDTVDQKKFTLPFNIRNGLLIGTIMQIYKWKYPDPLIRAKLYKDFN